MILINQRTNSLLSRQSSNVAPRPRRFSRTFDCRKGAVLVLVLVCFAVTAALMGAALKTSLTELRQTRDMIRRVQADWICESALARAQARLALQADYQGETWIIPADQLQGPAGAEAHIEVRPAANQPGRKQLHVRVTYGGESSSSVSMSRTALFPVQSSPQGAAP